MKKTKLHATVLLGIEILFAGCAVLTVDVDVYKGPLANHEDIQMEQMAAMAIGAKPLLIELRDILEANYMNRLERYELYMGRDLNCREPQSELQDQLEVYWKYGRTSIETRLRILRDCDWYEPNFVESYRDEMGTRKSYFLDSNADHVNNILSLYENLGDEGVEQYYAVFVRPAEQALKDYKMNYEVLRPESPKTDEKLWKEVGLKKDSFEDEAKLLLGDENEQEVKGLAEEIECLWLGYGDFCTNNKYRDVGTLFVRWKKIREDFKAIQDKILNVPHYDRLLKDEDDELISSSNAGFLALAKTSLVEFQAENLFGLKGEKKNLFVDHVKKISTAFLDTNKALERLWRVEMEAIIWLSNRPKKIGFDPERRIYEIARASLEMIETRRIAVLNNLLKTVDPNMVSGFVQLKTETPRYWKWKFADYEKAKEQLLTKFREQPAETARALLNAHKCAIAKEKLTQESLTKQKDELGEKIPDDYIWYVSGWEFGLTQIPFDKSFRVSPDRVEAFREPKHREEASRAERIASETMIRSTEGAFSPGAFGKGRLDEGLETLIEDYLKNAAICNPNEEELGKRQWARRRLQDALVRFAEKLLFVANNRSLMSPPKGDPGLLPGTLFGFYRLLLGEQVIKWAAEQSGGILGSLFEDTSQYTRILQAVGNSILVQADALHQEKIHAAGLERRADTEAAAMRHTLDQSAEELIEQLVQTLEADQTQTDAEIEKAEAETAKARKLLDELKEQLADGQEELEPITAPADGTYVDAVWNKKKEVLAAYDVLVEPKGELERRYAERACTALGQEVKTAKDYAAKLAEELDTIAGSVDVDATKSRLNNAAAYLRAKDFSGGGRDSSQKAYDQVADGVKQDHSDVKVLIGLAQRADETAEQIRHQERIIKEHDAKAAANTTKTEQLKHAVIAARNAKYAVLKRIDELGTPVSGAAVYDMLRAVLQGNQKGLSDSGDDKLTAQGIKYALAMLEGRPAPIDLKVTDLKLPEDATAKDVRDVWITLLEYEHDLALRNGDKARAGQILEAITAARKKREGMIFIRPAMAYLRTSFPATSLQGNPNLTWDNMLGEHMMRSIPFAPQIGEFLDPDAKRDARINAEIDKQFWQNINRVRVAGGGDTNYAVVKDDIGNWYVKGYSSDPCDVIESAKNLAMFAAGAQMGTNLLTPSNPVDGARTAPETSGSALESVFDKYRDEYRTKTEQEYNLLCAIMNRSEANISDQIKELWKANENANRKRTELETALKWSYTHFLKPFDPKGKEYEKDIGKQREQIIEGIKRLNQFRNDLTWKITNVYSRDGSATGSDPPGKVAAKSIVNNVVDAQIDDLLENRKDTIKTYEGALIFLAETTQQKE